VTAPRKANAPARTEPGTSAKPRRRRWADVAAVLECDDEITVAIAAFLSGEIDAAAFHRALEAAAARDRAKK
jgi:hypothetical protein